jgi:hypothetical protein
VIVRSRIVPFASVAVTLLVAALLLPGLAVGPSLDASVFSTVGWRLTQGDALYADVWDHKPPAAYLAYVVAHLLTDEPGIAWGIVWATTVASVAGGALVVRSILAREGIGAPAWVAAGLVALGAGSYLLSLGGGLGESMALLPTSLSLLMAVSGRWFAAGALAGVALAITPQALPVVVPLAVIGLANDDGSPVRRAALAVAGIAAVAAITVAWLWVNGGIGHVADALLDYSAAYRAVSARDGGRSAWSLVPWTVLVFVPLVLGIGCALTQRRRLMASRLAGASAAWIVAGLVVIALQGRFYAHYATLLAIPMAILAALGFHAMGSALPGRYRGIALGVPLGLSLAVSLAVGALGARDEQAPIRASNERAAAVAAELATLTDPGSAVFVWGNDARIYELADRRPASRYVYLYPLLTPGYVSDDLIADVLAGLRADPPAVVVDSGSLEPGAPGLPPLLIARPIATDGRDTDLLDPIRDLVQERYRLQATVDGWPIYVSTPP